MLAQTDILPQLINIHYTQSELLLLAILGQVALAHAD